MSLDQLLALVLSLGGVGSLIAVLINIGKTTGVIKDGQAQTYNLGAGLVVMVLLYVSGIVKPDLDVQAVDGTVAQIAQILAMTFSLIWPMLSARLTHFTLKGVPVLGRSYSMQQTAVEMARAKAFVQDAARREYGE